ncbi:MAG: DUF2779 domain-containing protein [Roseibacillus sp.]|jgi:hypothetical protein
MIMVAVSFQDPQATLLGEQPERWEPVLKLACKKCEYQARADEPNNGFKECWGELAQVRPHLLDFFRLSNLRPPGGKDPVTILTSEGNANLMDVPKEWLSGAYAPRQSLQLDYTSPVREYLSSDLRAILESHDYPLHFIDFEASRISLPYHEGMSPYQQMTFQWSCHSIESPGGTIEHHEWINLKHAFPNFEFARALRDVLGDRGTIYIFSHFEQTALRDIRSQMDSRGYEDTDLANWLEALGDSKNPRVVDMEKLVRTHHFHPRMGGRTSIKAVLPAVWENDESLWEHPLFSRFFRRGSDGRVVDPYKTLKPLPIDGLGEEFGVVEEGTAAIRRLLKYPDPARMGFSERAESVKVR